jgi:aspartyl-tRNA synthetase
MPIEARAFRVTDEVVSRGGARRRAKHGGERSAASELIDGSQAFHPMWLTDFPMFEYDLAAAKWMPAHHPFTAPIEADMANLKSDPASVRANCYDLAMNGLELGRDRFVFTARTCSSRFLPRLGSARKKRGQDSASSSTRWNMERRRMAALRWASIAS